MNYKIQDKQIIITNYAEEAHLAEIPETIEGLEVTELSDYAFSGTQVEEIYLPKTVKKIGRYAFYNCKYLKKISFYNTMKELGAGAFTGCHNIHEIELTFVEDKKSILREILIELAEEQNVTFHMEDGDAKLLFPEYFEESVENTPARILEIHTHGSGMLYRNCFVQKELNFQMYDEKLIYAIAQEFPETVIRLTLQRLLYPYQLTETMKGKYIAYLKKNLQISAALCGKNQDRDGFLYLAKHCISSSEELEILIAEANKYQLIEVLSILMQEKHKKFGTKRKTFEL